MVWGGFPHSSNGQDSASGDAANPLSQMSQADKKSLGNASKLIDAALREQMKKLAGRTVNLLTVGPSPSKLESATIRAMSDLFSKVKIRSISDAPKAEELVALWRQDSRQPPAELSKFLALGDLTVVQWLEPGASGLLLHTWYVKKDLVLAKDVYPWGEGTLPQETIDRLHQVILDPEMRVGG